MSNTNRITLSFPGQGETVSHDALGGNTFVFDFELDQASFTRDKNDLVISSVSDEGIIQLTNLYQANALNAPTFELIDSSTLTTPEFISTNAADTLGEDDTGYLKSYYPTIEFAFDEADLGADPANPEPVTGTVTLAEGYTVYNPEGTGWTAGEEDGTYTRAIIVDGKTVGKFVYTEGSSELFFVLEQGVSHESVTEVLISTKIWLADADGNLAHPNVEIAISADLPDIGDSFMFVDGSNNQDLTLDISQTTQIIQGYWEAPSDAASHTYELTYQLAGYPAQTITITLGQATTLTVNGTDLAIITFNALGIINFRPLQVFNIQTDRPLAGELTLSLTATDATGNNSASSTSKVELVIDDTGLDQGALYPDRDFMESDFRNNGAQPLTQNIALPDGWVVATTNLGISIDGWVDQGDGTWIKEDGERGELTYYTEDADGPRLTYTLNEALEHDEGSDEFPYTVPITLSNPGGNYSYLLPINVAVNVIDDHPEVEFGGISGNPVVGGVVEIDVATLLFGGDGPADASDPYDAYEVTITDMAGNPTGPVTLTPGVPALVGDLGTITLDRGDPNDATDDKLIFTPAKDGYFDISLTITDQDGDSATAVTGDPIIIAKQPDPIIIPPVSEEDLPKGNEDNPSQTVPIPDGWAVDTSDPKWTDGEDGTKVWENPDDIPGKLIYDPETGELTFELTDPDTHDGPGKDDNTYTIDIPLTHPNGATQDVPTTITITDDEPELDLEDSVGEKEYVPGMTIDIPVDLDFGADGKAEEDPYVVTITDGDGKPSDPISLIPGDGPVDVIIDGEKVGTIELEVDDPDNPTSGTIKFTPDEEDPGNYTVELTITDADGDSKTDSVTVPATEEPLLSVDLGGVTESLLTGGNAANAGGFTTETESTLPEGWRLDISKDGWAWNQDSGLYERPATVGGETYGTYTYDADTRSLGFVLNNTMDHPANSDMGTIRAEFHFTHENSSETSSIVQTVTVDIHDDKPVVTMAIPASPTEYFAGDDIPGTFSHAFGADGPQAADAITVKVELDGVESVATAVTVGGGKVTLTTQGGEELGTFELKDATNFIFTPNADKPGSATITLAVTDSDGDTTTAVAEVSYEAKFSEPIEFNPVSEADLPGGSNDTGEPVKEIFTMPEGWGVDTDDWAGGEGNTKEKDLTDDGIPGKLVYNPDDGTLTFELTGPVEHDDPTTGPDDATKDFDIVIPVVHTASGSKSEVPVTITINDDEPAPELPNSGVAEGGVPKTFTYDPNYGADGQSDSEPDTLTFTVVSNGVTYTGVVLELDYTQPQTLVDENGVEWGTIKFTPEAGTTGQFIFTAAPNLEFEVRLTLTTHDFDGDSGTSNTMNITVGMPPGPEKVDLAAPVDEAFLPGGSKENDGDPVQVVNIPPGYEVITDDFDPDPDDPDLLVKDLPNGTLIYDPATGELTYVLADPVEHPDGNGANIDNVEVGTVPLRNTENGNIYEVPLEAQIKDDVPAPELPEEGAAQSGWPADFDYDPNYGADGKSDSKPDTLDFTVTLKGGTPTTGTLTIDYTATEPQELKGADGTVYATVLFNPNTGKFTFEPEPDLEYTIKLTLTTHDTDGDTGVSNEMVLTVGMPTPPPPLTLDAPVDEAFLPGGSQEGAGEPVQEVDVPDGYTVDTTGWVLQPDGTLVSELPDDKGKLTYDPLEGTLTYELTDPVTHPDGNGTDPTTVNVGTVTLKDAEGNSFPVDLLVDVNDDVPTPELPATGEAESGYPAEFPYSPNYGADGQSDSKPDTLDFTVTLKDGTTATGTLPIDYDATEPQELKDDDGKVYATVKFDPDTGKFTFEPEPDLEYTIELTLTTHDSDGDAGTSEPMVLTVGMPEPPEPLTLDSPVDEAFLPGGSQEGDGEPIQEVNVPDGFTVVTEGWEPGPEGTLVSPLPNGNLIYDPATDTLSYELTDPVKHPDGNGTDPTTITPGTVTLKDSEGNTFVVPLKVDVQDDVPAPELPATGEAEGGIPVDFPYDPNYGADGQSDSKPDTLDFEVSLPDGSTATGTLPIDYSATEPQELRDSDGALWATVLFDPATGEFTFKAEPNLEFEITLTLTTNDTDGDTGTSNEMVITVEIPAGPEDVKLDDAVNEAYLPDGSLAGAGAPVQPIVVPDGYEVVTDGWELQPDGTLVSPLPNGNGNLIYNPDGTLSYELTNPMTHPDGSDRNTATYEVGTVPLKNTETGNIYDVPLKADIQDDVPAPILPQTGEVESGVPAEFGYDPNYGADGQSETKPDSLTFEITLPDGTVVTDRFDIDYNTPQPIEKDGVTYATITFDDATETFVFTAAPNTEYVIRLTLTTNDTDGDTGSSNRMVIGVGTPPPPPDLEVDGLVNEAYLSDGSLVGQGEPTGIVPIPDGYEVITTGWTPDPDNANLLVSPLPNNQGNLIYDTTDGTLRYELTEEVDHVEGNDRNVQENINVGTVPVIHTESGNVYDVPLLVDVKDDIPVVNPETPILGFAGDVLEGSFDFVYGADGPADTDSLTIVFTDDQGNSSDPYKITDTPQDVVINGQTLGQFQMADDGTLYFQAIDGINGELEAFLTATDNDGDSVTSDGLSISYAAKLVDLPFDGDSPFNEANLADGSRPDNGALTKSVDIPDGWTVDPTVGGWVEDPATGTWKLEYPDQADPYDDLSGYFTYDPSTPDKLYFTLEDNVDHTAPDPSAGTGTERDFAHVIKFVHTNGSTSQVTVTLPVADDVPYVEADPDENHLDNDDPSVTGALWVLAGADGSDNENDDTLAFQIKGTYVGPTGTGGIDSGLPETIVLDKDGTPQVFETPAGVLTLWYDQDDSTSPPTNVRYSYEARYGFQGYMEQFVFAQVDTDGDKDTGSLSFVFDDTFTGDLGLEVDEAAIPGLGSGQHFLQGDNIDTLPLPPALVLENATKVTWGEPENASSLRADADGDGIYSPITWKQVGNSYQGWSEGELIINVEAGFANGAFTGEITSTLYYPIYHTRPGALDEDLDIKFSLTQTNANESVNMGVNVNVRDDSPMRDYFDADSYGGSLIIIDHSGESQSYYESVYITLDASCSMSYYEGQKAVAAIKALAQSYVDNGVEAVFTLTGFHCQATTYYSHVTAEQLINSLDWSQLSRGKYSYFDVGLAETMRQMDIGLSQYENYHQTMYFLSDGCACACYSQLTAWTSYMARRGDTLDVNVINVDDCPPTVCKLQYLTAVAGGSENYYHYNDYEVLLNQFTDLVHTDVSGNMLGDIASADYTIVYALSVDGGPERAIGPTGTVFELADGVKLTVYQNGDYRIEAGKLTSDVIQELTLIIKDADGDTVEVQGNLILRDIAKAFDNVGVTEPYGVTNALASFSCTDSYMMHGCYRYTCFSGLILPGIPEYNDDLIGCRGYAALFSANKCVDGASVLRSIVGGSAAVTEMFNDMGMVMQDYGSNSIITFNVTDSGGTIAFNWAFKAGAAKYGLDSLFYFVTDSDGNVVNSGLLSQGNSCNWSSGVAYVDLPNYYDTYTLHIVQQEMGIYSTCPDSCLYLKDVVYFGDDQLRTVGNVLTDPSPDGFVDSLDAGSYLSYIVYEGVEYVFQDGKLEIDCGDGTLYITNTGSYTFISDEGVTGNVVEDFTYYVRTPDGDVLHADLHVRSTDKIINGTSGDDQIGSTGNGALIQAGAGDDLVQGGNGYEVIYGGAGNDTIDGGGGNDVIHGGHGSDLLHGGDGNDTIYGGEGNDAIYGDAGNDLLWGGGGINFLNGGTGADTFAWDKFSTGGRDIIADFNASEGDKLRFDDLLERRLEDFELNADQTGIIFQINFGADALNKTVEVRFAETDTSFADVVAAYNDSSSNSYHDDALLINYIQQFII